MGSISVSGLTNIEGDVNVDIENVFALPVPTEDQTIVGAYHNNTGTTTETAYTPPADVTFFAQDVFCQNADASTIATFTVYESDGTTIFRQISLAPKIGMIIPLYGQTYDDSNPFKMKCSLAGQGNMSVAGIEMSDS